MFRIYTGRIVTARAVVADKHPLRNRAKSQFISKPMGSNRDMVGSKCAVSIFVQVGLPYPAPVCPSRFVNLFPESLTERSLNSLIPNRQPRMSLGSATKTTKLPSLYSRRIDQEFCLADWTSKLNRKSPPFDYLHEWDCAATSMEGLAFRSDPSRDLSIFLRFHSVKGG